MLQTLPPQELKFPLLVIVLSKVPYESFMERNVIGRHLGGAFLDKKALLFLDFYNGTQRLT